MILIYINLLRTADANALIPVTATVPQKHVMMTGHDAGVRPQPYIMLAIEITKTAPIAVELMRKMMKSFIA